MLVYSANKAQFSEDVLNNQIADKIQDAFRIAFGHLTGSSEFKSWANSMMYMNNVLNTPTIPDDAGVAIEYRIPSTAKRIDFVLTGKDAQKQESVVIIELKQWSEATLTKKDGIIVSYVGKREREVSHPSYQAWSYASLLQNFNEVVYNGSIGMHPCAYLHNHSHGGAVTDPFYEEYIKKAPIFLKDDALKLRGFISSHVQYGDDDDIMGRIDSGKIRPSKSLADSITSLLQGKDEFVLIDDQKLVYETAKALATASTTGTKNVLIVQGGPGTGKSVVAINLLVALTGQRLNVQYVTKNAAPRAVYESKLVGNFRKSHISQMFQGSGAYLKADVNAFDALIVDEAHRLNEKSGLFSNLGENQIKEIIRAARLSVFFVDEDQRVTLKDIGEVKEIKRWAEDQGAAVHEMELTSQFRCNGSDGFLAWLDNTLQIRETANETLEGIDYDFRVIDSPVELRDLIFEKNHAANKARLVAGYCWDWASKKDPNQFDIVIAEHGFAMRWNLTDDGSLWLIKPDSVSEVGCIHTCQGLEIDYVGVIVGPDLIVRDGVVVTNALERSRQDQTIKGYKKMHKEQPDFAKAEADAIIKNTYRTLMTRGQKGCYIYCTDPETREYFANRLRSTRSG
jgi:DUF2075 family protein